MDKRRLICGGCDERVLNDALLCCLRIFVLNGGQKGRRDHLRGRNHHEGCLLLF
jgi:hypothetical protein